MTTGTERADGSSVQVGALVPLTRPGWVEAGRHLLAGLELAVREVNDTGGIVGRPLELVVRDTAADPQRAAAALLLLVGHPEPAVSIVESVRRDQRLAGIMIGAPAGQPEFAEWATLLGDDSAAIPLLRYRPERLRRPGSADRAPWPRRRSRPRRCAGSARRG